MADLRFGNSEDLFAISYRRALSHHMPDSHFHSSYEIYVLMSGKREFFIQDRTMVIGEGDIVIVSPNILHRTTNAEKPEHERLVINIHERYLAAVNSSYRDAMQPLLKKEYTIVKCSPQEDLFVKELSESLLRELEGQQPGFEMYMQTLVLQLLILCSRHLKKHDPRTLESPSPMHERISEIVRYINGHYMQELSLHTLAERFYVSPYYLSRFFKEATGFTFVEYLNSVRIKEAKKLLEQSSMKVSLIAKKVGFGSVTHFGRVFKTVTGHAPLHFRSRN